MAGSTWIDRSRSTRPRCVRSTASRSSPITRCSTTRAIVEHSDLVVDTRNAIKDRAAHVFRLGAPAREIPAVEMA